MDERALSKRVSEAGVEGQGWEVRGESCDPSCLQGREGVREGGREERGEEREEERGEQQLIVHLRRHIIARLQQLKLPEVQSCK